jgi:type III pantothenate kinase
MNLCIDQGNSRVKTGIFDGYELVHYYQSDALSPGIIEKMVRDYTVTDCLIASTGEIPSFLYGELSRLNIPYGELTGSTPLPFVNAYKTPETLGRDRLAAIAGAHWLMPAADVLVVDAGTAITFDFIDASGIYRGGNIAPGIEMRAKALHQFTSRLPFVEPVLPVELLGDDTTSAINSGIIYGAVFEIDGYIDTLVLKYPKLSTFLTGGSSFYFDGKLKNRTFAVKNLVLTGLNSILNFNVQK